MTSTSSDVAFTIVVVIHAAVAVVAFGAMALTGVYGSMASRLGRRGALEEVRRYFARPPHAQAAVVSVAPLGVAALALDPQRGTFAHLWVGLALFLWIVATMLWWGVLRPAEAGIRKLVGAAGSATTPTPDEAAGGPLARGARRLVWASAVTDVCFAVALGLMIFQPG